MDYWQATVSPSVQKACDHVFGPVIVANVGCWPSHANLHIDDQKSGHGVYGA
jgi:hypothetical protein